MTKFDTIHNDKTSSTPGRKNAGSRGLYVLGIMLISLIAFAPAVDAAAAAAAEAPGIPAVSSTLNLEPASQSSQAAPKIVRRKFQQQRSTKAVR